MSRMKLIILKGEEAWDMTNIVIQAKLSGRKGSSARCLTAQLLDDDNYGRMRPEIDVATGVHCVFYWDGVERFRGIVETQETSNRKTMSITAHDNGIYLANNKGTYVYNGKTASQIFTDICNRLSVPIGEVDDTGYVITELPKPKTTAWDVITDALGLTYEATGKRFWPMSWGGKMQLKRRKDIVIPWVIGAGENLISYSSSKSIADIKTRVKLLSDEDIVIAEASNTALEEIIGMRQEVEAPDDTLSQVQIDELAKSMLEEKSRPTQSLTVNAIGQADIISGVGVFIKIPHLGLEKTYYVESDNHTFKREHHTMSLSLVSAEDIDRK